MPQHIIRQIPACRLFPDSYLDPQKILSAKLCNDIFDSVVPARAAFFTYAQLPRRQTDVILNDDQPILRIYFEKVAGRAQALAA